MGQRKTLGGDRLGSGKKQKVDTATFNRSTFDLGYVWRSTMSAGTLVPFMSEIGLPGDNFDINLGIEVLTLPTLGPLFGSMKVQADVFTAPYRLYNGLLHNNKLGIGLNMSSIYLPQMLFPVPYINGLNLPFVPDIDNAQVNPSSILSYLGVRGFGIPVASGQIRRLNGVGLLAYWDIVKNYYANKQEENGWVIHTTPNVIPNYIDEMSVGATVIPVDPGRVSAILTPGSSLTITTTGIIQQPMDSIMIGLRSIGGEFQWWRFDEIFVQKEVVGPSETRYEYKGTVGLYVNVASWRYVNGYDAGVTLDLVPFPLANIDVMRDAILQHPGGTPFEIFSDSGLLSPYSLLLAEAGGVNEGQRAIMGSQEGLAVKTYQSDLFNNWLNTEYIDGVNGIAAVTAVSTVGDEFTIDSLILHKKVYDMLNDVLVSGGTYDDWQEVVYDHQGIRRAETPIYYGSLIKELQFQEVVSNSASETATGTVQPLGELAGRGRLGSKHKGGNINIKVDEISQLMGIISITPRIDYSQGNEWHMSLETMDDFHKPHMDEIGFQELTTDQMAWWDGVITGTSEFQTKSAGKQPAWINYQTNTNKVKGNFAIANNSMFMVLTRRYQPDFTFDEVTIEDLTTYIDPRHYNHIFAQTSLDSQNYWVQVGVDMIVRRKMSSRVMPNL